MYHNNLMHALHKSVSTRYIHLFFVAFIAFFMVGCADQLTSSEEAASTEEAFEFDEEATVRADYPDDLEMEILLPQPGWTESVSKKASTAQVQVVHNSPDFRAYFVDVYVNGQLAINNFRFRTATPFLELPTDLEVAIAPFYSRSVKDAIATFSYDLEDGESYVVVAGGVLRQNRFNRNPENLSVSFDLFPFAPARTTANNPALVDIVAHHGSTDAPTVDVVARGVATLVDDFAFGDFRGYVTVPPASYILDVTTADGSTVAASFRADLGGLAGGAATVLASGQLTPPGFRFRLIAVLADGTVIRLPRAR